ncbi:MAG: hypothetical protein KJ822_08345, partial [Proteobacteria bacterium]|nr:hypothetical protein [Pseudomonadota bacterium]MBU4355346.1 hypothetical protein [Pseudomonadota bacterium]
MVNISNRDLWYALGLSAIFLSGFVGTSLVQHYIIRPMRKRQHLRDRMGETRRDDLVRAKIFKTELPGRKGLIVTLMERTGWRATLDKLAKELMRAGIYKTPGNFLSLAVILASAGFILGRFVDNFLVSLLILLCHKIVAKTIKLCVCWVHDKCTRTQYRGQVSCVCGKAVHCVGSC